MIVSPLPGRSRRRMAFREGLACVLFAAAFLGSGGCVAIMEAQHPLTPQAKRVRVMYSGQRETTILLLNTCKSVAKIETQPSEHMVKYRANELGANVAQILLSHEMNGSVYNMDVRFWKCPPPGE